MSALPPLRNPLAPDNSGGAVPTARLREQDIATSPSASADPCTDAEFPGQPPGQHTEQPLEQAPGQPSPVLAQRFALSEHVATGGTVDVYRAHDLLAARYDRQQSTVALKVLSRRLSVDPALLAAILGAAAQMRKLRHPNIEQVLELHQMGDDYVIVTEWLDGESLAVRYDRSGPLSAEQLAPVLAGVGAALAYAHKHGVVHGDIKPGNVFLCADGRVKLVDCGFRLKLGPPTPQDPRDCSAGSTRLYASCEVLQNIPPTPEDDVYSLACLIYRVTTGEWPFGHRTALEAEAAKARPTRPKALSARQWLAVRRGLEFRHAERLSNAQELIEPFVAERARPPRASRAILGLLFACVVAWSSWAVWNAWQPSGPTHDQQLPLVVPGAAPGAAPMAVSLGSLASEDPDPPSGTAAAAPTIGFSTHQVVAAASTPFIKLKVRASGRLRGPVQLSVTAVEGAARVNEDFVPPHNRLRLTPSNPTGEVLISFLHGTRRENVEDFSVVLGVEEGYARLGRRSTRVVLLDH